MTIAFCCVADEKPKYLAQAVRWAWAIRWFGGLAAESPLFIGLAGDCPDHYRREFSKCGVNCIDIEQTSATHGPSNKIGILAHPELARFATVVLTDCDIAMVGDPSEFLHGDRLLAKPADAATLNDSVLVPLFMAAGKSPPARRVSTSIDRRVMLPYCNSGVVVLPHSIRENVVRRWLYWNAFVLDRPMLLGSRTFFTDQASFALALSEFIDDYVELPLEMNFPCHFALDRYPKELHEIEPRMLHYHDRIDGRTGYIRPVGLSGADRKINEFNRRLSAERRSHFSNSVFWDERYVNDPELGSGIGSRGEHADYKAELIREFLSRSSAGRLVDFGCGDCSILERIDIANYVGVDASRQVVNLNKARFPQHEFICAELPHVNLRSELSLCLDVLIHQPTQDDFDAVLDYVIHATTSEGLVNGFDEDPRFDSDIVYFHKPLRVALAERRLQFEAAGSYRSSVVYRWSR